jgi:hypothetical protein
MNCRAHALRVLVALAFAAAVAGCATRAQLPPDVAALARPAPGSVLKSVPLDSAQEDRILALDPEHVSDEDVRNTLARGPTPHVILIHGGVYPVHLAMASLGRFLAKMGYPEAKIRDPGDRSWSLSPYASSADGAGLVAWYYEHDGVRPMIVGHSQGGIQAVKILHELSGSFGADLHPYDPESGQIDPKTTIVDPLTGQERAVVGLSTAYVGVVGAGGWSLVLPNHWIVAGRIRSIPDTVDEFVGYRIGFDLFAWDAPGLEGIKMFYPNGKATVRNVTLPAEYSHVLVPVTSGLADTPAMRAWINNYDPAAPPAEAPPEEGDTANVIFAAEVWHSIKRHWVVEAQRFVRAKRGEPPG